MTSTPLGWIFTTIGDVAEIVTGKTPSTQNQEFYGGDIPFLKPPDLDNEPPLLASKDFVTVAGAEKARILPVGSVAVSCIGNLGKVAILGRPAITNQQINSVLPSDCLEPKFVYYWAKKLGPWLEANSSATTVAIINKGRFSNAPIEIPPLNEQRRIVAKIEELTARSRAAKEALDAIPPLLERFRQSVLAAAFRGDLTKRWREQNPDVEPASVLLERIRQERRQRWEEDYLAQQKAKGKTPKDDKWKAKYQEPKPVDTTDLPELPEGWCWATLDSIADLQGGIQKGKKRRADDILRSVPYLRVANVQRGHFVLDEVSELEATEIEIRKLKLQAGDILFNEGGDRDKLGRGWVWSGELAECIHQNHVFRARLYLNEIPPELISHYGNSLGQAYFLQHGAQTTNLASLSLTKLGQLPVPLTPIPEQMVVLEIVTVLMSSMFLLQRTHRASTQHLLQLNQSILAKAFRGELVPQDPNDEPASVLLERIRAEREATSAGASGKKRKARK